LFRLPSAVRLISVTIESVFALGLSRPNAIAWKASDQAERAVTASIPWLMALMIAMSASTSAAGTS